MTINAFLLAAVAVVAATPPQAQTVQVTVPRANVRAEPSERAPILQQVTPKDQIEWRATDGDWFKVLLPPNPALGGARVEAYISKKVARLGPASATPAAPAAAMSDPVAAPMPKAATVFLGVGADGVVLSERTIDVSSSGNRDAWTIPADLDAVAASKAVSFDVSVPDGGPIARGTVTPVLVKLSDVRGNSAVLQVASLRGDRDWKADDIETTTTSTGPDVWHLVPDRALKPGRYAIVLRPTRSGIDAPRIVWPFEIRK